MSDQAQPIELAADLLRDAFGRVREDVTAALGGLDERQLLWRPDPGANSIAWLVWHLSRIQDDHLAGITGRASEARRVTGLRRASLRRPG